MDAVEEDVVCSCAKTSSVTNVRKPFRSLSRMQFTNHSWIFDPWVFLLNVHANVFFRSHTHHCVYIYSFQPMFYYLIDWPRLSISFIDPFTIPFYHCNLDKSFIQDANFRSQNKFLFWKRHCIQHCIEHIIQFSLIFRLV